uniref:Putative ovule protein n=1 Tax=Solanum chacoense TaxID=4108 RepID=A0A0V0GX06_SOLCH
MFIIISLGLNIYICILFSLCAFFSLKLTLYLHFALKAPTDLRAFLCFSPFDNTGEGTRTPFSEEEDRIRGSSKDL